MNFEDFWHSLLLKLDPEIAHFIAKLGMRGGVFAPGRFSTDESRTNLFGVGLDNPFGIAAGFDKHAKLHSRVRNYGFGWIECGSFTWNGGRGNAKPRLFRLEDGSLLNRMGLNNCGAIRASIIFSRVKDQNSFAVNIAKTHDPNIVGDAAIEDIVESYSSLKNFGIYTAINVSCPNTREGKTFEMPIIFQELNSALKEEGKGRPLVYKLSPGLGREKLERLVEISDDFADGYEVVNTQGIEHHEYGNGGLSGSRLRSAAVESVRTLRGMTDKPIIAVGGISTEEDAYALRQAGATVFLVFTGFVYRHKNNPYAGPRFAHRINQEYFDLVRKNGD